jgi:hypothetical protein
MKLLIEKKIIFNRHLVKTRLEVEWGEWKIKSPSFPSITELHHLNQIKINQNLSESNKENNNFSSSGMLISQNLCKLKVDGCFEAVGDVDISDILNNLSIQVVLANYPVKIQKGHKIIISTKNRMEPRDAKQFFGNMDDFSSKFSTLTGIFFIKNDDDLTEVDLTRFNYYIGLYQKWYNIDMGSKNIFILNLKSCFLLDKNLSIEENETNVLLKKMMKIQNETIILLNDIMKRRAELDNPSKN